MTEPLPSTAEVVERNFPEDVAKHGMTILLNMPAKHTVHLEFSLPDGSWLHRFQIITGPGWLMIRGDMGCYVFERTADMISWFLGSDRPNPSYWSQKVEAVDARSHRPGVKEFSKRVLRRSLTELASGAFDDEATQAALIKALEEQVIERVDSRDEAVEYLNDFLFETHADPGGTYEFDVEDAWEIEMEDWEYRFLWACHAIHWGLTKYRAWKPGTASFGG